jgi:hypothetical protein
MECRRHEVELFADYFQFYLWDAGKSPLAPDDYTDDDTRRRVKVAPHVVVVLPVRNMTISVQLEVCDTDPGFDASDWDHVAECSIELPSGRLQVHECTGGSVLDLTLAPGTYRVRVQFSGLDTLSEDGLDGKDHYCITLWPGSPTPLNIVKQWPGVFAG